MDLEGEGASPAGSCTGAKVWGGARAPEAPSPATVSRRAGGWPSFQEALEPSPGCSWWVGGGGGRSLQHNLINFCHPTKWEMVYSDGWGLPEVCACDGGRGGGVQDLQGGPGSHHVYVHMWLGVWGFLLNSSPGAEKALLLRNLLLEFS